LALVVSSGVAGHIARLDVDREQAEARGETCSSTHCNVWVVFAPVTSGNATGTLTVSAVGSSHAVSLSGSGK